jgi:lipoprotein-anchoring transpeptidase ErfK/SrfK
MKKFINLILGILVVLITLQGCQNDTVKSIKKKINLKGLLAKLKREKKTHPSDTANFMDSDNYDPSKVDSNEIMDMLTTVYESDSSIIAKLDTQKAKTLQQPVDSLLSKNVTTGIDTFTNEIKKIAPEELTALKENLNELHDSTTIAPEKPSATRKDCKLWADVSKTDQRLYLYVDGECIDTFKVSTGTKGHETPKIDRRPSGPVFRKYTSKKYPGGNYNGLGNMPYVVFVQGGYGIHGTTLGNIPKLGKKASHGCVRVHPDNAKIFNEMVRAVGIENTWVTIRD